MSLEQEEEKRGGNCRRRGGGEKIFFCKRKRARDHVTKGSRGDIVNWRKIGEQEQIFSRRKRGKLK